jgi:hypothetical protein
VSQLWRVHGVLVSLNLIVGKNCLRFYGSDTKCESARNSVEERGRENGDVGAAAS